jgi:hypothetical protein
LNESRKSLEGTLTQGSSLPLNLPTPKREIATVQDAMQADWQKYTRIDVPILAIYALPHERRIADPAKRAEADERDLAFQGAQAKAFEKGLPSARVIWLAHADHYVFRSNEADVLQEMNALIAALASEARHRS